ncbi:MAG: ATP-binding protein [Oligoflexales bacterium]
MIKKLWETLVQRRGGSQEHLAQSDHALHFSPAKNSNMPPIIEAIPQMVWMIDARGYANFFNQKWSEFTGIPLESSLGFGWMAAIHPDDRSKDQKVWQKALDNGEMFESEQRLRTSDGGYKWTICRALPIKDANDKVVAWAGSNTDISETKAALEKHQTLQRTAEAGSLAKSQFLANMSHQIRTPLNVILGFSNLLRQPNISKEEQLHSIEVIHRSSKELDTLIGDILDMSKIEAGRFESEMRPFRLTELLAEVVSSFASKAKDKKIELILKNHPTDTQWIISDPVRLRQILVNVVGNAVKLTTEGHICIATDWSPADEAGDQTLTFTVQDTGSGIAAKYRDKLFEPFVQADSSTARQYGGTGLGLALARQLAHILGGDLVLADTTIGEGSKFVLTIQAKAVSSKENAGRSAMIQAPLFSKPLAGLQILVAEDLEDNQNLIRTMLQNAGASVQVAINGFEAVQEAMSGNYDLVLMDIHMPILSGYDAASTLRAKGYKRPIIAVTAHAIAEGLCKSMEHGCNAFVTKPIEVSALIDAILQNAASPRTKKPESQKNHSI